MKSLIALIIVILSVVGMIGAVIFALNFRSIRNPEAIQIAATQPDDVERIELGGLPLGSKPYEISEPGTVKEIVSALKRAKISNSSAPDALKYVDFIYKGKRPTFRMWFSPTATEQRFGPELARLLDPHVRQIPPPPKASQ